MTSSKPPAHSFVFYLGTVYLSLSAAVLVSILCFNWGHFSYSLDDPYIHLALAQQIAHLHYGINAGEVSSPSSSILWPFLLAPFSPLGPLFAFAPLLLNLACGLWTCVALGRFLDDGARRLSPETGPLPGPLDRPFTRWCLALLWVGTANLVVLAFIGMEHSLQIALVAGCAIGIVRAYRGAPVPAGALACAALAPAVRYEDLAFTLAVVLVCWLQRRRAAALLTLLLGLLPVAGFSWFLHRRGLPWLPCSVLVKSGFSGPHTGIFHHLAAIVADNLYTYLTQPMAYLVSLVALGIAVLTAQRWRQAAQRNALAAALLALAVFILVGPYGWFYRYEVCVRVFGTVVLFGAVVSTYRVPAWSVLTASYLVGVPLLALVPLSVMEATHISRQQFQMHRFVDEYDPGNVAVNDLGWVAYNHPANMYVLDLVGLATKEALVPQERKDAAWLDGITREHRVGLVMIYDSWFGAKPASWVLVAQLHDRNLLHRPPTPMSVVSFYATPEADLPALRAQLRQFAPTLPDGSWLTVVP